MPVPSDAMTNTRKRRLVSELLERLRADEAAIARALLVIDEEGQESVLLLIPFGGGIRLAGGE